ncbi:G1 family glutamic endopeptidase [Lysobacter sp. CA199]|uniref:G1 family glutamic endopeptidase n=1 Tax=Lysobacter sp. CA199 TaxID=3455608 RepID=UPI003F8D3B9D
MTLVSARNLLALACLAGLGFVPASQAKPVAIAASPILSSWAGQYAGDSTHRVNSIFAYFRVPSAVRCPAAGASFSALVGLNGNVAVHAPQATGLETVCNNGVVSYRAWWRMSTGANQYISSSYILRAGDVIGLAINNMSVSGAGAGTYQFDIVNFGTTFPNSGSAASQWRFKITKNGASILSTSGRVGVESIPRVYPNFGSLTFSSLGGFTSPAECNNLFYPPFGNPNPITPACPSNQTAPAITTTYAGLNNLPQVTTGPLFYLQPQIPDLLANNIQFTVSYVDP